MKKYTHAWLAMMAMKRIEKARIPLKQRDDAKELITWFKNYRDFVISGSWYPDAVFKDMATSHIVKYTPDTNSTDKSFRIMPRTLQMYQLGLMSDMFEIPFTVNKKNNLCDRCEAFTQSLVDSFKILTMEMDGSPIVPSCNHIAMRFFILSHYIADCHMPLHCDARSFADDNDVHAFIEEQWDAQVKSSYRVDEDNNRFYYDPDGYPLKQGEMSELTKYVEKELEEREFIWDWGAGCGNTWDYMSGISQYSYLMAYRLIPADIAPSMITRQVYRNSEAFKEHFDEYSKIIMGDAVESIAKVWLHAWVRYRSWYRGTVLANLKERQKAAKKNLDAAKKCIDTYEEKKAALTAKVEAAEAAMDAKQQALDTLTETGKNTEKALTALEKARQKFNIAQENLLLLEVS